MRRLLLILVLCISCSSAMKGEQLVATLQSGDATKMFYGHYAAKDAYEEAVDGDIITLSKGNFEDFTIEKTITLRGAGAFVEGESTVFKNLNVYADNAIVVGIQITEKMLLKGNKQQILRCNLAQICPTSTNTLNSPFTTDIYIGDCAINHDAHARACVNATYNNCSILYIGGGIYDLRSATFDHCIVDNSNAYGYYHNCIIHHNSDAKSLKILNPSQFYDTLICSTRPVEFEVGVQKQNCDISRIDKETYLNKFGSDQFPYFFSEEVTTPDGARFVCGVVDHKEWPAVPRVVESNIAKETDEAGHLKVQVKVSCER